MDTNKALRAISNEARLKILHWLKNPAAHFGEQPIGSFEEDGVCVSLIQKKAGLSQSTTSQYLTVLHNAGLVKAKRVGQWTYYKRDDAAIERLMKSLHEAL